MFPPFGAAAKEHDVGERLTIEGVLSDHAREVLAGATDTALQALAGAMPRPLRGRARRDLVPDEHRG